MSDETTVDGSVAKAYTTSAGFGGTYDHVSEEIYNSPTKTWGFTVNGPGIVKSGPTEDEIRLRESAIALTIEYFKGSGEVELETFDAQLHKFYGFLQTGNIQQPTTEVGF